MSAISMLQGWADGFVAQVGVDAETVRDTADEVLSRRPYLDASRPPSIQERVFNWLLEEVGDLLNSLSSIGGRGFGAWLIIGFFLLLAAWMLWKLKRSWSPLPSAESLPDPEIEIIAGTAPEEWLAEAQTAESEQRWPDAIRLRHRALVATLVDDKVISPAPGQTAGSIAQSVSALCPAASSDMAALTGVFKQVWYGSFATGRGDLEMFRGHVARVEASLVGMDTAGRDTAGIDTAGITAVGSAS